MAYSETFRITNYQIGEDSVVKNAMLARFMQHMATVDLEENYGWSRARLLENEMCFILIRTAICNHADIKLGDLLRIDTSPDGIEEAFFLRRFVGYVQDKRVFSATTLWCVINPVTRRIIRPKATGLELNDKASFSNDLEIPRRVIPGENSECIGEYAVRYSDIDCNQHMNNTAYFSIIDDYLPDPFTQKVRFVKIEYSAEAVAGDKLEIYRSSEGNGIYHMHALRQSDGKQCFLAKLEVTEKQRSGVN